MKQKLLSPLSLILTLGLFQGCELLEEAHQKITEPSISEFEIGQGLKEALDTGAKIMADSAGLENGYWNRSELNGYAQDAAIRILLPQEAQDALTATQEIASDFNQWKSSLNSQTFGISDLVINSLDIDFINDVSLMESLQDSIWQSLNKAAEMAAPQSKALFKEAITGLSFEQASSILFNQDSSAGTQYLEGATFTGLQNIFKPIVTQSLQEVKANQLWTKYTSLYNDYLADYQTLQQDINQNSLLPSSLKGSLALPLNLPDSLPTDLSDYTTEKALNGLFNLVSQEEVRIRRDPFQYANNIIEEIFSLVEDEITINP